MVVCPRTGRAWPDEHRSVLRDCHRCGGLIDIRKESWHEDGGRPVHPHECPPQVAAPVIVTPTIKGGVIRLTGKQMIEAIDARRDLVHEAAMELARQRQTNDQEEPDESPH